MTTPSPLAQALEALRPFAEFGKHVIEIGAREPVLQVSDDSTVSIHINSQWGTFLRFENYRRASETYARLAKEADAPPQSRERQC